MGASSTSKRYLSILDKYPQLKRIRATWDKETGQLKKARGLLTEKSRAAPKQIASRFIDHYSQALGKEQGSILTDLKLVKITQSPAGYEIKFQQYVHEAPVYRAQVLIYLTKSRQVYRLNNGYRPAAGLVDVEAVMKKGIEAPEACRVAVEEVQGKCSLDRQPTAELTIYKLRGKDYLSWQISVALKVPTQVWKVFVDMRNGQILEKVPILMRD